MQFGTIFLPSYTIRLSLRLHLIKTGHGGPPALPRMDAAKASTTMGGDLSPRREYEQQQSVWKRHHEYPDRLAANPDCRRRFAQFHQGGAISRRDAARGQRANQALAIS